MVAVSLSENLVTKHGMANLGIIITMKLFLETTTDSGYAATKTAKSYYFRRTNLGLGFYFFI